MINISGTAPHPQRTASLCTAKEGEEVSDSTKIFEARLTSTSPGRVEDIQSVPLITVYLHNNSLGAESDNGTGSLLR